MIRNKLRRETVKQLLAISSRLVTELFKLPRFTRTQLTTFCVDHDFQRGMIQVKLSDESTTRSEREQMIVAGSWRQHHHSVKRFGVLRRGKFVVFRVGVVSEIGGLAQCAPRLRKHLKAFAIKPRRRR